MGILPSFEWRLCGMTPCARDDRGLSFDVDEVGASLAGFDLLVVPGGYGTRSLQHDAEFLGWLSSAAPVPFKASVCTGSILLGAAGFLKGLKATTHFSAYRELAPYCAEVVERRIVDSGAVVTARGVTAAIDLGLHLCERIAGAEARARIAKQMDYPYRPDLVDAAR
jgi:cyclohexyl-isocyanide hydratase